MNKNIKDLIARGNEMRYPSMGVPYAKMNDRSTKKDYDEEVVIELELRNVIRISHACSFGEREAIVNRSKQALNSAIYSGFLPKIDYAISAVSSGNHRDAIDILCKLRDEVVGND